MARMAVAWRHDKSRSIKSAGKIDISMSPNGKMTFILEFVNKL